MGSSFSQNNNNGNSQCDDDEHQLLTMEERNDSLQSEGPLETLTDSILFIQERDEKKFRERNRQRLNQDAYALINSPMISTPHLMTIPDSERRRTERLEEHAKQKERKKILKKMLRSAEEKGVDIIPPKITFEDGIGIGTDEEEHLISIGDEDEQWEQKRLEKKRKMIKSTSAASMANSRASSTALSSAYSPSMDIVLSLRNEFAKQSNPLSVSVMYGLVNFVIVLPVIMSFGNIIYQHEFFKPYLPVLIKLTVFSGVVHQVCFSTFSTMPFSVGQVQDAGLIFLSAMVSDIVEYCQSRGYSDEEILATSVIGLSIFTAILGISLVVIGHLKLASYVKMLPTSVIGGYLAFIGYFCGQSGMSLMSGASVSGILEWNKFFEGKSLELVLPGFMGGLLIYLSVRNIKHMLVLPVCVTLLLGAFYMMLETGGYSLEDARSYGWINEADDPPVWYKTWTFFKFDKVVWAALPRQSLTLISMVFVVALSSSLDIAAIDLELPKPLEYNYELRMVGLSNIISGVSGGYTGSYIFSQTIFSLRVGIRSRMSGYTIALLEAVTMVIPLSILNYIPNYIFGSLLIMICVDLMIEWLWDIREKITNAEYTVALSTFCLIQILGVEYGILSGVGVHIILLNLGFDVKGTSTEEAKMQINDGNGSDSVSSTSNENGNSLPNLQKYGAFDENNKFESTRTDATNESIMPPASQDNEAKDLSGFMPNQINENNPVIV